MPSGPIPGLAPNQARIRPIPPVILPAACYPFWRMNHCWA